ncbi:MAG: single-stranded DNA-binding protein [Persephonella sp.]|nr:MAG: single-stranded DNA-binding protein [Persephonella sp.]RUM61425.1 MAG: single-stranded DNA-binding protein [Persephonella sp.]
MLNKVLLIGRLTRDPEVRFFPSGTQITTFSIAYNRRYKVKDSEEWKEEPHYFDVETYGMLAERLGRDLSKGYQVLVEGRLAQQRWENQAGEKRSKVIIIADRVVILSKPMGTENRGMEEEDLAIPNNEPEDLSSDEDIPF